VLCLMFTGVVFFLNKRIISFIPWIIWSLRSLIVAANCWQISDCRHADSVVFHCSCKIFL
jgi:membrane-anchored glycerophosphoryl diester phosphodiesterase (GDPDase)